MSNYWIQTFTGKKFDLGEPSIEMLDIVDIAHHLSLENRFNGASKFMYSVGYHSILCSSKAENSYKLEALLHDAAEAYIKDLTSPIKKFINLNSNYFYDNLDERVNELISIKFKLDWIKCAYQVKQIDIKMVKTEREQLFSSYTTDWNPIVENIESYKDIEIMKLQPENVEELFLKEFYSLERK